MGLRPYIAYYRVSTDRQGRSGLGLEAQQQAVRSFLHGRGNWLPLLWKWKAASAMTARKSPPPSMPAGSTRPSIIAKLDRLARNVHFISGLMESGVEFIAVDMPEANRLTIHIPGGRGRA